MRKSTRRWFKVPGPWLPEHWFTIALCPPKRSAGTVLPWGKTKMIKVMHVITTLGPAGAETMLCRIASGMDRNKFENEVVSLTGILDLADRMEATGARVRTLGMKKGAPNPMLVMRLAEWIRESKPDGIHTWMYHANLIGAFAARLAGNVPVAWSVHHSVLDA